VQICSHHRLVTAGTHTSPSVISAPTGRGGGEYSPLGPRAQRLAAARRVTAGGDGRDVAPSIIPDPKNTGGQRPNEERISTQLGVT
jgi:hypothetical protein